MSFIIVFNNDFSIADRLLRRWADKVIVIAVVDFPDADVGHHLGIGNRDGIGIDIAADNVAYLTQGLAVDVAK
jgi:hypothetical protein